LINKIWPLDLSFNPLEQVVNIQTQRKLPYELTSERTQNRNRYLNKNTKSNTLDLPRITNKYDLYSRPALDFSTTSILGGLNNGLEQALNIGGRNDLLRAQANYNFSFRKVPSNPISKVLTLTKLLLKDLQNLTGKLNYTGTMNLLGFKQLTHKVNIVSKMFL